jgi:hypothetical protein
LNIFSSKDEHEAYWIGYRQDMQDVQADVWTHNQACKNKQASHFDLNFATNNSFSKLGPQMDHFHLKLSLYFYQTKCKLKGCSTWLHA